ncbi:MAG: hypothetical protein Q9162_004754 [Coniocarpon cinnabarinum]
MSSSESDPDNDLTAPADAEGEPTEPDGIQNSYDLHAPAPAVPLSNIELLAQRLFSLDHLKLIVRDSTELNRFQTFLQKYKPDFSPILNKYVQNQKAISAIEYANAIARKMAGGRRGSAAVLDAEFEMSAEDTIDELVNHALPTWITHRLVQIVTETLVKEITGQNTPIMRELVAGLAEVYCLTDPSLPDNPIVYASEEFFRCTQYGREYVIGKNCRFLQGPQSSQASIQRLVDALADGEEMCETILNYRRDGSPFINLLMIAPLFDNKGKVRYFIGAQIDVNGLVEGGRGLDSFERLLARDKASQRYGGNHNPNHDSPDTILSELAAMWTGDEIDIVRRHTPRQKSLPSQNPQPHAGRRYLGMEDPVERHMWPARSLGTSGRLPGVFQNYLLVRPFPSLRITFTSPALRIPGLLQSKFLDRIGGPQHIRDGIHSAFTSGIGVTAKITWLPALSNAGTFRDPKDPLSSGTGSPYTSHAPSTTQSRPGSRHVHTHRAPAGSRHHPDVEGRTRWIHCTPLLGADEQVGVWMVVMVESESITGALNAHERAAEANAMSYASIHKEYLQNAQKETAHEFIQSDHRDQLIRDSGVETLGGDTPKHHTPSKKGKSTLTDKVERKREEELRREQANRIAQGAVDEPFKDF